MESDDERIREIRESVQRIFRDAVRNQPPFVADGTAKPDNQPSLNPKLCCVTQHKYNSTLREEKRREECSGKKGVT